MPVLHVAEKNRYIQIRQSIAKEVANILSNSNRRTGYTLSKYNPIFQFQLNSIPMKFTSVRGHIFDYQLPSQCKSWGTYDNKRILLSQVPLIKILGFDMNDVVRNLQKLAKQHNQLVLWLDCDRQGEAIAFQVIQVCTKVNPLIKIKRARFSAVTRTDIWNAYNNLIQPNKRQADAVNFRIQIDFRMGCTFTRYQTVIFQKHYELTQKSVISYGPCQMPTLSFVVDRYLQIKYFKSEKYWIIEALCIIDQNTGIPFTWGRKNTRDQTLVNAIIYSIIDSFEGEDIKGTVKNRKMNPKKKYRPYPLTTVAFQKLATDKLKMTSARAMEIAQKLYQKGLISYPRTETNAFPKTMNLKQLVKRLENSSTYNSYIQNLLNAGKFMNPKVGNKDDQAHSPIHPVKLVELNSLDNDQRRVYDMICRHFLACCSKDAIGQQYQVKADIGCEQFKASYLTIKQKNYLEIYPYERWVETSFPAEIPERFPVMLNLKQSQTTPPGYLTESQLIDCMQKNQIGTDSTIHEHIETIQKRQYAIKSNNTFKPTNMGASLIQTYRKLGIQLPECQIRRNIEKQMNKIAEGEIARETATRITLTGMQPLYDQLQNKKQEWIQAFKQFLDQYKQLKNIGMEEKQANNNSSQKRQVQACRCPICMEPTFVRYSQMNKGYFVGCSKYPNCKWAQSLPHYIEQIESAEQNCLKCVNSKLITIKAKQGTIIDQLMMRIRFQQTEDNKLNICLSQGCDPYFYENIQQSTWRCNKTQWRPNRNRDDNSNNQQGNYNSNSRGNMSNFNRNNSATNPNNFEGKQKKQVICFKCKQIGHIAPQCPSKGGYQKKNNYKKDNKISSNFPTTKIQCFKCKQIGHIAPNCPNNNRQTSNKKFTKQNNRGKTKKVCPLCGTQGRHPKFSNCPKIKRKGTKSSADEQFGND